jgi:secondary thiamine-phosphate synthase enzyme
MLYRDVLEIKMKPGSRKDITKEINEAIEKYSISDGLCNIFIKGTTAGLMINEDDKMLRADIEKMLNAFAPSDKFYQHPENADSHLKAMLFGNTLSIPIADGKLLLGSWQNVMLWEFDVIERERILVITMIGG